MPVHQVHVPHALVDMTVATTALLFTVAKAPLKTATATVTVMILCQLIGGSFLVKTSKMERLRCNSNRRLGMRLKIVLGATTVGLLKTVMPVGKRPV